MRQVFGIVSALALSCVSVGVSVASESPVVFGSDELRVAEAAFQTGQPDVGLAALEKAAGRGNVAASLRLADVYDQGKMVPQDRVKACEIYTSIVDSHEKVDRFHPLAGPVGAAFRKAGNCYAKGLNAIGWQRNMSAAAELFFHGGMILQDPESLFELAKLYLSGEGIPQNTALAINSLDSAARKQFPPAQALLGLMMWEGKVMKRRAASGLALLMLAKERTSQENRAWIGSMYDDAMITASKDIEDEALTLVDKWNSVHGNPHTNSLETVATVAGQVEVPAPSKSPTRELKGLKLDIANGTDRFGNQTTRANVSPAAAEPTNR